MQTLRNGSRGADVMRLQRALHLIADGIFGKQTEMAVMEFQRLHGLEADGVVGPNTWAAVVEVEKRLAAPAGPQITLPKIKKSSRSINRLIVHCTATPEGKDYTVATIRKWHTAPAPQGNGWSDIGYHYVIYRDGSVMLGRDVDVAGAHTTNYNLRSIGIVYVGGLAKDGKTAKDTRTPAQKQALRMLLQVLKRLYPTASIHGHRDFAAKACPSFDATKEYADL